MSELLNKIKINGYEINQIFVYQSENTYCTNNKIRLDQWTASDNKFNFIEYMFIVFEGDAENIKLVVQANGFDLWSRKDYIFHNKIYPMECENLYDSETNNLLKDMVRTSNLKNVLFVPFRTAKNGCLLDISPSGCDSKPAKEIFNIILSIYDCPVGKIDIFMKVSDKNSDDIDKFSFAHIV